MNNNIKIINVTKLAEAAKVSYDRLNNAVRYKNFDGFKPKEKTAIVKELGHAYANMIDLIGK